MAIEPMDSGSTREPPEARTLKQAREQSKELFKEVTRLEGLLGSLQTDLNSVADEEVKQWKEDAERLAARVVELNAQEELRAQMIADKSAEVLALSERVKLLEQHNSNLGASLQGAQSKVKHQKMLLDTLPEDAKWAILPASKQAAYFDCKCHMSVEDEPVYDKECPIHKELADQ